MARGVGIGLQDFSKIQKEKVFYIDKTKFIKEWWDSKDEVVLIAEGQVADMGKPEEMLPKMVGNLVHLCGKLAGK